MFDIENILSVARETVSPISHYAYYLASEKKVYGEDIAGMSAFLYATYMKHAPVSMERPGLTDGCSVFILSSGKKVLRVIVNNVPQDIEF